MKRVMRKTIVLVVFMIASGGAGSQPNVTGFLSNHNRAGFLIAHATQELGQLGVGQQDHYQAVLLKWQYNWALTNWQKGGIEIIFQPQLNFSRVQTSNLDADLQKGLEFGVNIGVLARKNLFQNKSAIYALISAGPHFITKSIETQANGFLFADNLAAGFLQNISSRTYLDFRFGYRHLSNAGLKQPNWGIDNWVISIGVNLELK